MNEILQIIFGEEKSNSHESFQTLLDYIDVQSCTSVVFYQHKFLP